MSTNASDIATHTNIMLPHNSCLFAQYVFEELTSVSSPWLSDSDREALKEAQHKILSASFAYDSRFRCITIHNVSLTVVATVTAPYISPTPILSFFPGNLLHILTLSRSINFRPPNLTTRSLTMLRTLSRVLSPRVILPY